MIFTDEFIDAPWGKLCVVTGGPRNDKPVVFLHGLSDSAGCFIPLVNRLPNGFRMIMPELPGCGKSVPFPPGQPLYMYDYIIVLKLVVDHYKLEKFSFVGHSMGAQIGLLYNIIYPDKIDRFTSLDSLTYAHVEASNFPLWFKYSYERFYDPKNYQKFISKQGTGPLYTYDQALETVMKSRGLTRDAGIYVLKRTLIPAGKDQYRFCWEQRMKVIPIPAFSAQYQLDLYGGMKIPHLIVFADESVNRNLQSVKAHLLETYVKKNPHFRTAIVKGNHDVHINSPEVVVRLVAPFLMGSNKGKEQTEEVLHAFWEAYESQEPVKVTCKL